MRFLFTCIPGLGHFHPLLSLARALERAGHDVAFATAPAFADAVSGAGFEHIPAGLDWDERHLLETVPELREVAKPYRGEWMMKHLFLDRSPRAMIPDLAAIAEGWRPDLIVAGSFEYGGPLAAEKLGLPHAIASYTVRWNPWILKHALGPSVSKLRKAFGLRPDPDVKSLQHNLLCFAPPSWTFEGALLRPELTRLVADKVRSTGLPPRQRMWGLRALLLQRLFARFVARHPEQGAAGADTHFIGEGEGPKESPAPAWLADMPKQPNVFVSLGTVLSAEYPDIFDTVLAALRDRPVNVIMTMGGRDDPARFGPQPDNVRIVPFMKQDELRALLPHVDLGINHAGYGSVMEALIHGIPLVLLPLVSDAPMNAQMCLSTGVTPELPAEVWGLSPKGLPVIRPETLTPAIIGEAAMRALEDPAYRDAARRIERELAACAGLEQAVAVLEYEAKKRPQAA